MYVYPGRGRNYYRCSSKSVGGTGCGNGSTPADWLEARVAEEFLSRAGHFEVMHRVFVPGESHAEERAETEAALGRLVERLEKIPSGGASERAVLARMREHEEHLAKLAALPETPDRWEDVPTGETFRQVWTGTPRPERPPSHGRRAGLRVPRASSARNPGRRPLHYGRV